MKPLKIRIAGIVPESTVDGPGYRFTIFTQGCHHSCPGCHNPQTHPVDGGTETTADKIIDKMTGNPLLSGITLSGGEPFLQPAPLVQIAQAAHEIHLNVMVYTGYTIEKLLEMAKSDTDVKNLIASSDIIVDGPFLIDQKDLTLRFRGSKNQRIIDAEKSLEDGRAVLTQFDKIKRYR